MTCSNGGKFRLTGDVEITVDDNNKDICDATKIVERLHKEFTEKGTDIARNANNPTYYLRNQSTNKTQTDFMIYLQLKPSLTPNIALQLVQFLREILIVLLKITIWITLTA